jgi:hypothetical protein
MRNVRFEAAKPKTTTTLGDLIAFIYEQASPMTRDSKAAAELAARALQRLLRRTENVHLARRLEAIASAG